MPRPPLAAVLSATVLLLIGCSSDYDEPAVKPVAGASGGRTAESPTPPPAASAAEAPSPTPPATEAPAGGSAPAAPTVPPPSPTPVAPVNPPIAPAPIPPQTPPSTLPAATLIKLSTPGAQPVPTTEGTAIGFYITYEIDGEPSPDGYVWVIERAHGAPAKIERKLERSGTIDDVVIVGWRPEDAPFQSHFEDRKGNRVSASVDMPGAGK
jgi:hypothetical protein